MLIYDIETKVIGSRPNPEKDTLKFFGWLKIETGQSGMYNQNQLKEIQQLIDSEKIIVGFNVEGYDNPILRREGINLDYKRIIDLYDTVKKRKTLMKLELQSYSLKSLAKHFNLKTFKQEDFNYDILKQDKFSEEDIMYIWKYLKTDLQVTKELWDYLVDYFSGFKNYLNEKNVLNYSFVSCSGGSLAYKAICNNVGLEEEYNEMSDDVPSYEGGFVSLPKQEMYEGDIYLFDFASLYPHMFIQANLYSHSCECCNDNEKWNGNDLFKDIKGKYCTKKQGIIETVIKKLYLERLAIKNQLKIIKDKSSREYIELDRKQIAIKIIINTMYGISGSPIFKHVYNLNTASDCTYMARETVKFARKIFDDNGYEVIYTDTDSVFLKDPFNDFDKLINVKNSIIEMLRNKYPFPQDTFDLQLETKIKKIYFFKKNDNSFAKKFYVYLNDKDEVIAKGIPVVKSNASNLSKKIFHDRVIPHFIESKELLIDKVELVKWINEELQKDISLASFLFRVGDFSSYKIESQLQAQVSKFYGAGDHWLIPNYYCGAGLCLKYCTVDDFIKKGMKVSHIALDHMLDELTYFCFTDLQNKKLNRVQQVRMRKNLERNNQSQLQTWW